MSMNIGKNELVALARDFFEDPSELENALRRCNEGFVKKLEKRLWDDLREKFPERDFTGGKETKTRVNLKQKLKTSMKCKFNIVYHGIELFSVALSVILRSFRKATGDQVYRVSSITTIAREACSRSDH